MGCEIRHRVDEAVGAFCHSLQVRRFKVTALQIVTKLGNIALLLIAGVVGFGEQHLDIIRGAAS